MKISAIRPVNVKFAGRPAKQRPINPYWAGGKIAYGTNYEILNTPSLSKSRIVDIVKEAARNGKDISYDKDRIIYSRIGYIQEDAREFCEEHPEFSYDDVLQDLIEIMVKMVNKELSLECTTPASVRYHRARDMYFDKILKAKQKEDDYTKNAEVKSIAYDNTDNIADMTVKKEVVENMLSKLKPRDREIFESRFGIDSARCSHDELGRAFDLSGSRVGQILQDNMEWFRSLYQDQMDTIENPE